MVENLRELFLRPYGRAPDVIACAPGRVEFIGNHTDSNDGPVLGEAIDHGVWVALAGRTDSRLRMTSDGSGDGLRVVVILGRPLVKDKGGEEWINCPPN